MLRYLARRLVFSLLLVAAVSSAALLLTLAAPGDITSEQVGSGAPRGRSRPSGRGSGWTVALAHGGCAEARAGFRNR
jgi:hypothetical protein